MNGAIAVPPNNMSKPRRSSIINIGNSHHFLLCLRKNQNSASKGVRFSCANLLNSPDCSPLLEGVFDFREFLDICILHFFSELVEVLLGALRLSSAEPIALCRCIKLEVECITAH